MAKPTKSSLMKKTAAPIASVGTVLGTDKQREGDAEAPRSTTPLPLPPPSPEASVVSVDDVASSIEGEAADQVPQKASKKRPAWMGNWGRGAAVDSASSATAAPKAEVNIITGLALSPASPSAKQPSVASRWGKDKASVAVSSRSGAGSGGPPRMVMRDGSWQLEGHEEDMLGLAEATPVLQARLLGGVKAEQVGGEIVNGLSRLEIVNAL